MKTCEKEGWAHRTAQHMLVQISGISLQRKVTSGGRARMDVARAARRMKMALYAIITDD